MLLGSLIGLPLGIAIGLVIWALRWRRYRRAMASLDEETKHRHAWYRHCEAQPREGAVTVAPGFLPP